MTMNSRPNNGPWGLLFFYILIVTLVAVVLYIALEMSK